MSTPEKKADETVKVQDAAKPEVDVKKEEQKQVPASDVKVETEKEEVKPEEEKVVKEDVRKSDVAKPLESNTYLK